MKSKIVRGGVLPSSGRRQRFMYRPSGSGAKKAICANWRQDWGKQTNCQTKSPRSDDARMNLWQKIFTWEILMSHCLGVAAVQDRARVAQEFEASKSMWYPVLVPHITWWSNVWITSYDHHDVLAISYRWLWRTSTLWGNGEACLQSEWWEELGLESMFVEGDTVTFMRKREH